VDVRENLSAPAVAILQHITEAVVFMISWHQEHLTIILGSPFPELTVREVLIS
jgi:hypothetical protein